MANSFKRNRGLIKKARGNQVLLLVIIILVFALIAVLGLVLINQGKKDSVSGQEIIIPSQISSMTLYAPVRNISSGAVLQIEDFKEIYWPKASIPEDAVLDKLEIKGFAKRNLFADQPLTRSLISLNKAEVDYLKITPGMRAIAIEIDAKRGVEGWALPGSRVDVILTYLIDGKELSSKIVVENAKVLSTGGDVSTAKDRLTASKVSRVSPTVTLEVNPRDALKIETAIQLGSLSLHLRAPDDDVLTDTQSIGRYDIEGKSKKDILDKKEKTNNCIKGRMKIDGKDYIVDCNGELLPSGEYE